MNKPILSAAAACDRSLFVLVEAEGDDSEKLIQLRSLRSAVDCAIHTVHAHLQSQATVS